MIGCPKGDKAEPERAGVVGGRAGSLKMGLGLGGLTLGIRAGRVDLPPVFDRSNPAGRVPPLARRRAESLPS